VDTAEFFEEVMDYRVPGRCGEELSAILRLVLCGLLAECETVEDIYDYARSMLARYAKRTEQDLAQRLAGNRVDQRQFLGFVSQ